MIERSYYHDIVMHKLLLEPYRCINLSVSYSFRCTDVLTELLRWQWRRCSLQDFQKETDCAESGYEEDVSEWERRNVCPLPASKRPRASFVTGEACCDWSACGGCRKRWRIVYSSSPAYTAALPSLRHFGFDFAGYRVASYYSIGIIFASSQNPAISNTLWDHKIY